MNRRGFFTRALGAIATVVVYPLDKAFEAALKPSKEFEARLGEWNNYYSEGDPEIMEAIENWKPRPDDFMDELSRFDKHFIECMKSETSMFEALASYKKIPVNAGVNREFFQYSVKS